MSKIFEQLVKLRGLKPDFLNPQYGDLTDPFLLPGMREAVTRIKEAISRDEKILIYGDYDADGITASTLMEQALVMAGASLNNIVIILPDRFADGYGMSPKLIKRAESEKVNLVITVDCGSRNHDIIDELKTIGIDCIVTDHHETDDSVPDAIAVINPKRKDHPTDVLHDLAGVGVAFKIAQALVKEGLITEGQEKWLLDLVVIGTICDNMLLTGENRVLGFYGLKVLAKTRRPGLIELMNRAGVKNLDTDAIGFQIGPRLNAAGRLDTADLSLNLLRTNSALEAAPLALRLEELNKKRKTEQNLAMREIEERGVSDDPVIIETGKWHEGVLGIIAGRLVEQYRRPAFALAETTDGIFKGSGRSFGEFNLADALKHAGDVVLSGGGHAGAAGVKIKQENLYRFREVINEYYRSLKLSDQSKYFQTTADLEIRDFSELNLSFLDELKTLEPFGAGNEEPVFKICEASVVNVTRMGDKRNHLRLDLRDKEGRTLKCLAFFAPEEWLNLDPQFDQVEPLVKFILNDFNGVKTLEARIVDLERDNL